MDMKNLPKGTKVRTLEMLAVGSSGGQFICIPAGEVVTVQKAYDAGEEDAAYRVLGTTNFKEPGTAVAFHDEIEEV